MRSFCSIGAVFLMHSGALIGNETQDAFTCSVLDVADLLTRIENTAQLLTEVEDERARPLCEEFKEILLVLHALNSLSPESVDVVARTVENICKNFEAVAEAFPHRRSTLEPSLELLISAGHYQREESRAQPMEDWIEAPFLAQLGPMLETNDVDLVYIQDDISSCEERRDSLASYNQPRLLYKTTQRHNAVSKVLVVKKNSNPIFCNELDTQFLDDNSFTLIDSRDRGEKGGGRGHEGKGGASCEFGVNGSWGDGDGVRWEGYAKGGVHDREGNYAEGQITQRDDGTGEVTIRGGHEDKDR